LSPHKDPSLFITSLKFRHRPVSQVGCKLCFDVIFTVHRR